VEEFKDLAITFDVLVLELCVDGPGDSVDQPGLEKTIQKSQGLFQVTIGICLLCDLLFPALNRLLDLVSGHFRSYYNLGFTKTTPQPTTFNAPQRTGQQYIRSAVQHVGNPELTLYRYLTKDHKCRNITAH